MKRSLKITVLMVGLGMLLLGGGAVHAGDAWLDANGIRIDNANLNGQHVTNATYWIDPPFLSAKVPPNVLFVLDNSGSMNCPAYDGSFNPQQFVSGNYFGYFIPTNMYRYNGTTWQVTAADPSTATAANPIASGNLLNWASMRRIDVAKRLLNGGKASPRSPNPGFTVELWGEDPDNNATCSGNEIIGTFNNSGVIPPSNLPAGYTNVIYPFVGNYTYRLNGSAQITVNPPPLANPILYPKADLSVPATWTITGSATAWDAVNDTAGSSDATTTISTTTLNAPAIVDYNYTGGGSGTIKSVSIIVLAKKSQSNNQLRMEGVLDVLGNRHVSNFVTFSNNTNYQTITFTWNARPDTNLPWEWSDLKMAGPEPLRGFGVQLRSAAGTNNTLTVTQMYLLIEVDLPAGGPYNVRVDTGKSAADTGIIGQLSSDARFGLMFYNTDAEGGNVANYIDFDVPVSMITSIDNVKATTWTPLAETLYSAVRYLRQDAPFYHNGDYGTQSFSNRDPYYYMYSKVPGSGLADQYVPCAKSFVLMLTDGEPTQDLNIPAALRDYNKDGKDDFGAGDPVYPSNGSDYLDDIAAWARMVDARPGACATSGAPWPCIPGDQRIFVYPVFMFGSGSNLLQRAAIWGGFEDLDGNNAPSCIPLTAARTQEELKECLRDSNGDGVLNIFNDLPLTYYQGNDGYALQVSIIDAIAAILKRSASGTSVSVLGSSWKGEGAMYQAFFYPEKTEGLRRIKWTGYFHSLMVDRHGLIHEDTDGDRTLTPEKDHVIEYEFVQGSDTKVKYFWDRVNNSTGANEPDGLVDSSLPTATGAVTDMHALWDAGKLLAKRGHWTRTIYTSANADKAVPTLIPFDGTQAPVLRPFLRTKPDATETYTKKLVNFIRGSGEPGWRDRQLTVDGTSYTWKLGDIVFSDPVVVPAPKERYDVIYGDKTYAAFYNKWSKRRNMVYVGANDGMLHAFNGGFSVSTTEVNPKSNTAQIKFCTALNADATDCADDLVNPLGKEMWAFIPFDVLPHLAWLADPEYQHVYYVDQMARMTDARIFPPDADHVNGWGTILIVGLRLGGGEIDVTDTFGGVMQTKQFRSAYYALDVTNPDLPPTLLWRFTVPELGFTLSVPSFVREEAGGQDYWYMVVGSGPSNFRGARAVDNTISNTKFTMNGVAGLPGMTSTLPHLFILDLKTGKPDPGWTPHPSSGQKGVVRQNGVGPGFFTSITSTDFPLDFKHDVLYFGAVLCIAGCSADGYGTWGGNIYRLNTGHDIDPGKWTYSRLFQAVQPITAKPAIGVDERGNAWVYFGTGRFIHIDDRFDATAQTYYGIKDPCYFSGCTTAVLNGANLLDANSFSVNMDGTITPVLPANTFGPSLPTAMITRFSDLANFMRDSGEGWKIRMGASERVIVNGFVVGGIAGFGSYKPNQDICEFEGRSRQYFPYYLTGTVPYFPGGSFMYEVSVDTGGGLPSVPALHVDSAGNVKLFLQKSTGEIQVIQMNQPESVTGGFGYGGEVTE